VGSLVLSAAVWFVNTSIFWLVFRSLPGGGASVSWLASAVVLFCAALGLAVQIPGVGGGYQVSIILALNELYNQPAETATGAAIIMWLIMSIPGLLGGLGLLVHEGLTFRKLESLADEERQLAEKS
jgi:uncharacterized membrane protein YbhN (UPF0104 family)